MASCLNFCQENETPYFKIKGQRRMIHQLQMESLLLRSRDQGVTVIGQLYGPTFQPRLPGVSLFNSKLERYSMNLRALQGDDMVANDSIYLYLSEPISFLKVEKNKIRLTMYMPTKVVPGTYVVKVPCVSYN
ncbi:unnamed protein product [Urochloa humidicola]